MSYGTASFRNRPLSAYDLSCAAELWRLGMDTCAIANQLVIAEAAVHGSLPDIKRRAAQDARNASRSGTIVENRRPGFSQMYPI